MLSLKTNIYKPYATDHSSGFSAEVNDGAKHHFPFLRRRGMELN
jgi:hypothetical protein